MNQIIKQPHFRIFAILISIIAILITSIIFILANPQVKTVEIPKEVVIEVEKEVVVEVEVEKEVIVEVEKEPQLTYEITSEEREMLARLLYREARGESLECQKAVVSVIINRWNNGYWGDTLHDVVYAKNQFTPAGSLWKTTPNEMQYEAVDYVIRYGSTLPDYVMFFRARRHFTWDGYHGYAVMGSTYFGYVEGFK